MYAILGWNNKYYLLSSDSAIISFTQEKNAIKLIKDLELHKNLLLSVVNLDGLEVEPVKRQNIRSVRCNSTWTYCAVLDENEITKKLWLSGKIQNPIN